MEWRTVPEFDFYEVSENGDIRSYHRVPGQRHLGGRSATPRLIKPKVEKTGYLTVNLFDDAGSHKTILVHTIVCSVWHGPRPPGQVVRHKDNNQKNNNFRNLHWGTPKQNKVDQAVHGTLPIGERCYQAKLTERDITAIRLSTDRLIDIAAQFSVSVGHVCNIRRGVKWKHVPTIGSSQK